MSRLGNYWLLERTYFNKNKETTQNENKWSRKNSNLEKMLKEIHFIRNEV
jgi:hypothetical protein